MAEEAYGGSRNIKRHDAHQSGYRDHFQPAKRKGDLKTGHVFYGDPKSIILMIGTLGAAAATEVEARTGSELAGHIVGFGIDLLNPVADVVELEGLAEEIGTGIIEELYEVDLEAEEIVEIYPEE